CYLIWRPALATMDGRFLQPRGSLQAARPGKLVARRELPKERSMSIPCAEAEGKNQGFGKIVQVFLLCLAAVCLLPSPGRADLVIFKDGFLLSGKIKQDKEIFVDPLTKAWFPVARLNGFYMVDDGARRVIFSESQVADATRQDVNQAADVIKIGAIVRLNGGQGLGLYWKVLG